MPAMRAAILEERNRPLVIDQVTLDAPRPGGGGRGVKVTGAQTILFFGDKLPASTLIATPALAHPDWLIEVEAIAVI